MTILLCLFSHSKKDANRKMNFFFVSVYSPSIINLVEGVITSFAVSTQLNKVNASCKLGTTVCGLLEIF